MPRKKRLSYEAEFKLTAIALAEQNGNRKAALEIGINESMVRNWRKQKSELDSCRKTRKAFRKNPAKWPKLEAELFQWIQTVRAEGRGLTTGQVRLRAVEVAESRGITNFTGNASWCYRFMKRHNLSISTKTSASSNSSHAAYSVTGLLSSSAGGSVSIRSGGSVSTRSGGSVSTRSGGSVSTCSDGSVSTRSGQRDMCCVCGASSEGTEHGSRRRSFFPFPRDYVRCREWLRICGLNHLAGKSSIQLRSDSHKVCSDHFDAYQFRYSAGPIKLLVLDALPGEVQKCSASGANRSQAQETQRKRKSASPNQPLHLSVSSLIPVKGSGKLRHVQTDGRTSAEVEVEVDYAEDPALHYTGPRSVTDVVPAPSVELGDPSGQAFTANGVDIKVEPLDTVTDITTASSVTADNADVKREHCDTPTYTTTEHASTSDCTDIKVEPQETGTDITAGTADVKVEHLATLSDVTTQPPLMANGVDVKVEPTDTLTDITASWRSTANTLHIKKEPRGVLIDITREHALTADRANIKVEPQDTGIDNVAVQSKPLHQETEPLNMKAEPLDTLTHKT